MLSNGYIKTVGIVLVALLCMTVFVQHVKNGELQLKLKSATKVAESAQTTIDKMQEQNKKISQLYVKQQKDYENAQAKVFDLERSIADGSKRLHINATCDQPVPAKSTASSVDDVRAAQLTRDAERTYIRLRHQITSVTAQVNGLRSYIDSLPSECVAR